MYFNGETDEDFDNLNPVRFVKNTVKKIKKIDSVADVFRSNAKIDCIDDSKNLGVSNKDSRVNCRKELGGNIFVRGAKKLGLSIPRGSFLTLVRLNYRGLASRMNRAKLNEPNIYNSAISKFVKLGGNKENFTKAIEVGKNKRPLACGKKCKAKKGLNFGGNNDFSQDELDFFEQNPDYSYSYGDPATVTVTASIIASASAILVPIINIIGKGKMTKLEAEIDREEAEQFAEQQEQQFEEDEKKRESNQKMIKTALIGGSILVGVLITGAIVMKVVRRKRG